VEKNTYFDLTRHPVKKGQFLKRQDDPEKNIVLPEEGLVQAQEEARKYAEDFSQAPKGSVFWALASDVSRTQETRFIFDMEMNAVAREIGDAFVIDLNGKMPGEEVIGRIRENKDKKIILINGPIHPGLGQHKCDWEEYAKLEEELGSEKELISKWEYDPVIAKRVGVEYKEITEGYKKLLEDIKNISKDIFSGREVWVKGFGHCGEIEIGLAAYADKTAREIIERAGGNLLNTMESVFLTIKPDGKVLIRHRDQEY
jgi:hypothetical protein